MTIPFNALIVVCLILITNAIADDCPLIERCDSDPVLALALRPKMNIFVPDEKLIAAKGDFNGLKPLFYSIYLNFPNPSYYEATVNISVEVVQLTKLIMLHMHETSPALEYSAVVLSHDCRSELLRQICIEDHVFIKEESTLVLELNNTLPTGTKFTIVVRGFETEAKSQDVHSAHHGLLRTSFDDYTAVYTNLFMRKARTIMPCFDHPTFKTRFGLTIRYPAHFIARSNTPALTNAVYDNFDVIETTFETTNLISVHSFAFALISGYTGIHRQHNNIWIYVQTPTVVANETGWILDRVPESLFYFQGMIGYEYPLSALTFVVVPGAAFSFASHFGLVILSYGAFANQDISSAVLLHGAILKQWLGNIVTVGNWNEICLQESLSAYFMMLYEHESAAGRKIQESCKPGVDRIREEISAPFTEVRYTDAAFVEVFCQQKPVVIYHMLVTVYGRGIIQQLLRELVFQKRYETVDLIFFNYQIAALSELPFNELSEYMTDWYTGSGSAKLQFRLTGNVLNIVQNNTFFFPRSKPLPLLVYVSEFREPKPIFVQQSEFVVQLPDKIQWFAIDLDGAIAANKVYERKNYLALLKSWLNNPSLPLTFPFMQTFASEFCDVLMSNDLPLSGDLNAAEWQTVMRLMSNFYPPCRCCLLEIDERSQKCSDFDKVCETLRLVQHVGYVLRKPNETHSIKDN